MSSLAIMVVFIESESVSIWMSSIELVSRTEFSVTFLISLYGRICHWILIPVFQIFPAMISRITCPLFAFGKIHSTSHPSAGFPLIMRGFLRIFNGGYGFAICIVGLLSFPSSKIS